MIRALLFVLAAVSLALPAASQTSIRIINSNAGGEGFNDPTPRAPVGGNEGTTLGEQRLIAFQHAANLWAALLESPVEIRVQAFFEQLSCSATSAILGSASPITVYDGVPNAPRADLWYVSALASRLAGIDFEEGGPAITTRFNSGLEGDATCGGGKTWYYGLDNQAGLDQYDLVIVVLHELAHGLGFATVANKASGALLGGRADIYSNYLHDNETGLSWPQMTDEQRAESATSTNHLVWSGTNVTSAARDLLGPDSLFEINSPPSLQRRYTIEIASFGGEMTMAGLTAQVAAAEDQANVAGPAETDGCTSILNPSAVTGRIALIDRGECTYVTKAKHAQVSGALAVIIVNNEPGGPAGMSGNDPSISIPVIGVSQADGLAIRERLDEGVVATLRQDPQTLAGADDLGRVKLYAPSRLSGGSSVSHWDRSAEPDLLMEPSINSNLRHDVDLARDLFADLGWYASAFAAARMRSFLLTDQDGDREIDPGDSIRMSIAIRNETSVAAQSVALEVSLPEGVALIPGTVTGGTGTADEERVTVVLGNLPVGAEKSVTLDLLVDPALGRPTTSLSLQARVSGSNLMAAVTDDPSTALIGDPTVIIVSHTPLRALKSVELAAESDASGGLTGGDLLRYRVTVANHSVHPVSNVLFDDVVDANTMVVAGSVTADGGVVTGGNAVGDLAIEADFGVIPPGGSVAIQYDVIIEDEIPEGTRSIVNQGTITGDGVDVLLTDDPATREQSDATKIYFGESRRRSITRH